MRAIIIDGTASDITSVLHKLGSNDITISPTSSVSSAKPVTSVDDTVKKTATDSDVVWTTASLSKRYVKSRATGSVTSNLIGLFSETKQSIHISEIATRLKYDEVHAVKLARGSIGHFGIFCKKNSIKNSASFFKWDNNTKMLTISPNVFA